MFIHIDQVARAKQEARAYLLQLKSRGVPYSLNPIHSDQDGTVTGLEVGVDMGGPDGFSQWLCIPFDDNGEHEEGFILRGTRPVQYFERSSMPFESLARCLSLARNGELKACIVHKGCDLQILEFQPT